MKDQTQWRILTQFNVFLVEERLNSLELLLDLLEPVLGEVGAVQSGQLLDHIPGLVLNRLLSGCCVRWDCFDHIQFWRDY